MYDIRLKQIECFLEVADSLNISQTANKLYISQPLASKWIKSLEDELGVKLFNRGRYGLNLTPAGEVLKTRWRPLYNDILRSIEEMKLADVRGVIKIGCLEDFNDDSFKSIIDGFRAENPEIEMELSVYGPLDLMEQLMKGRIDVAFHTTIDLDDNTDVKYITISKLHHCIAMSRDNILATRESVSVSDLKQSTFYELSSRESPASYSKIHKLCNIYGFEPRGIKEFHNISSLMLALSYSDGVSVTLEENLTATNNLKIYPIDEVRTQEYLALIYPAKDPSLVARRFAEYVRGYCK